MGAKGYRNEKGRRVSELQYPFRFRAAKEKKVRGENVADAAPVTASVIRNHTYVVHRH